MAAFLPNLPNTGFGDVRCRIGAERLFIYLFYSFFSFFIFLVLFQFFCIFNLSLQLFHHILSFVFKQKAIFPCRSSVRERFFKYSCLFQWSSNLTEQAIKQIDQLQRLRGFLYLIVYWMKIIIQNGQNNETRNFQRH